MIILGALAILAAFSSLGMGSFLASVFWAAIGSVLIARGISKRKQRQDRQQAVISESYVPVPSDPAPRTEPSVRASAHVVVRDGFPVAGVTFKNDDGSSRQKILRNICDGEDYGSINATLEEYLYKGSPAVRVVTSEGCVGNIRRSDVDEVLEEIADGKQDVLLEVETFENEEGKTIYRADVFIE